MKRMCGQAAVALLVSLLVLAHAAGDGPQGPQGDGGRPANNTAAGNGTVCRTEDDRPCNGTQSPPVNTTCPRGEDYRCNGVAPSQGSNGQGSGQGQHQGPRGDDDRPRNWGAANNRGETEYDDRKSPRKVAFLGKSANVRIYPNYSDPSVYLQLRFGKVQELDAQGRPVPHHSVQSLADSGAVSFAAGNMTVNGVNMSYVNVTVNPADRESFDRSCRPPGSGDDDGENEGGSRSPSPPPMPMPSPSPASSGGRRSLMAGGRSLLATNLPAPQINVSILFGLDAALTFKYGSANVTVPANGLKWTVSYRDWPFCNTSNTLVVGLDLLLANNASAAQVADSASNGATQLRIVLGSAYNATLSFLDYALTGPQSDASRMPVNVSVNTTASNGVASVRMVLPNPASVNATSVWYDPTQTTTSTYLSASDPGNVATATVTTGSGGSGGGSAGALRTTLWTAIAAVLLSALLAGAQQ